MFNQADETCDPRNNYTSDGRQAPHSRTVEDVLWTSYNNLNMWFTNWKIDLVKLGFANKYKQGEIIIPADQMRQILNIDKTCLSLDGSNGARGGRPEVVFYDP